MLRGFFLKCFVLCSFEFTLSDWFGVVLSGSQEGGLADGAHAGQGLHSVLHARGPGPEGARHHRKTRTDRLLDDD